MKFSSKLELCNRSTWLFFAVIVLVAPFWTIYQSAQSLAAVERSKNQRKIKQAEIAILKTAAQKIKSTKDDISLSSLDALNSLTDDIHHVSAQNGLVLADANYKMLDEGTSKEIGSVEINAHLKGAYPGLKKTIGELLAAHEDLALQGMALHRDRAADILMEMEIRFTFFYRKHFDIAAP